MEKRRPYRKFNFGIENYNVISMWKKSIWKEKKTYRKFDFGIRNYVVRSM